MMRAAAVGAPRWDCWLAIAKQRPRHAREPWRGRCPSYIWCVHMTDSDEMPVVSLSHGVPSDDYFSGSGNAVFRIQVPFLRMNPKNTDFAM